MLQVETERYQVVVELADGREQRLGPVLHEKAVIENICSQINTMVAEGKEKTWRNARCATVEPEESGAGNIITSH